VKLTVFMSRSGKTSFSTRDVGRLRRFESQDFSMHPVTAPHDIRFNEGGNNDSFNVQILINRTAMENPTTKTCLQGICEGCRNAANAILPKPRSSKCLTYCATNSVEVKKGVIQKRAQICPSVNHKNKPVPQYSSCYSPPFLPPSPMNVINASGELRRTS
jgi:hypothetical protein